MKLEENVEFKNLLNIQTLATKINTGGGKSLATRSIFKQ
jgi:hypothetical protein